MPVENIRLGSLTPGFTAPLTSAFIVGGVAVSEIYLGDIQVYTAA
tara:strand:- start:1123 stop:1257 length:135 start_codon:yes stop_codon:yes gene_type:complete